MLFKNKKTLELLKVMATHGYRNEIKIENGILSYNGINRSHISIIKFEYHIPTDINKYFVNVDTEMIYDTFKKSKNDFNITVKNKSLIINDGNTELNIGFEVNEDVRFDNIHNTCSETYEKQGNIIEIETKKGFNTFKKEIRNLMNIVDYVYFSIENGVFTYKAKEVRMDLTQTSDLNIKSNCLNIVRDKRGVIKLTCSNIYNNLLKVIKPSDKIKFEFGSDTDSNYSIPARLKIYYDDYNITYILAPRMDDEK